MKKMFFVLMFLIVASMSSEANAAEKVAGSSAQLAEVVTSVEKDISLDNRVIALRNVLENYGSPLADEAENFVLYADKYGIDWRLLVSIAGLESGYASRYVFGSYNAYGWGGGYIYFDSWEHGIESISRSLRTKYYDRGANTVEKIGPIYAENPHWSARIRGFMSRIDTEYNRISLLSLAPQF